MADYSMKTVQLITYSVSLPQLEFQYDSKQTVGF